MPPRVGQRTNARFTQNVNQAGYGSKSSHYKART
jgi:hypothetical protein